MRHTYEVFADLYAWKMDSEPDWFALEDLFMWCFLPLWQVWDVLSNKEVVEIVASAPPSSAARKLVESANIAWKFKCPYAKVDDCAVVCLFLNSSSNHYSASTLIPNGTETSVNQSGIGNKKDFSKSVDMDHSGTL